MTRFLRSAETSEDRAEKAAGKKQTATTGCRNTHAYSSLPDASPITTTRMPLIHRTPPMVLTAPARSASQPPVRAAARVAILENPVTEFAATSLIPCTFTRYRGSRL